MPHDFTQHDLEVVERRDKNGGSSLVGEQINKDAMKLIENPYWFDFDGTAALTKDAEKHYYLDEVQHSHRRRAKRNHKRKLKATRHSEKTAAVVKRSINDDENIIIPDQVFSASEVISNIFNENDTRDSTGKYDGN